MRYTHVLKIIFKWPSAAATSLVIITSKFFLANLLVHTYDLLENRRTDEVINNLGGFFII